MEELTGQLLLQADADFDTFGEAGFFMLPAEGTDDVDDLIFVPQAQFLDPGVQVFKAILDGRVVETIEFLVVGVEHIQNGVGIAVTEVRRIGSDERAQRADVVFRRQHLQEVCVILPYEGEDLNGFFNKIAKSNFSTMRSDLNEFQREVIDRRTKKAVTIQNEVMRSHQEVEIANLLYLHNIDYEYEPLYKYDIVMSKKPYTPDFVIRQGDKVAYIEHFGITQDGKNDRFGDDELTAYKKAINDKVALHKKHGTALIHTFSKYLDGKSLLEHLQDELEKKGFDKPHRSAILFAVPNPRWFCAAMRVLPSIVPAAL